MPLRVEKPRPHNFEHLTLFVPTPDLVLWGGAVGDDVGAGVGETVGIDVGNDDVSGGGVVAEAPTLATKV